MVCDYPAGGACCPRCGTDLEPRKPHSLSRSWAFLLAGLIFYVPANVLPVMYTQSLQGGTAGDENTIMSGVIEFWQSGSWDIAVVIFIASIVIPSVKFIALGVLLLNARRRHGGPRCACVSTPCSKGSAIGPCWTCWWWGWSPPWSNSAV